METVPKPIFYDERGRRWPVILRASAVVVLVLSVLGFLFSISIVTVPLLPSFKRPALPFTPDPSHPLVVGSREKEVRAYALARDKRRLDSVRAAHHPEQPVRAHARDRRAFSVVAGFYVNWNPSSYASLTRHADALTHLIPEWMHLSQDGEGITTEESGKVIAFAAKRNLPIMPLLNNAADEDWKIPRMHHLLVTPRAQDAVIARVTAFLLRYHFRGLNLDLEGAPPEDRDAMTRFVTRLADTLHRNRLLLSQDLPVDDPAYNVAALGRVCDFVIPMLYDEHETTGGAGPIASQAWFERQARLIFSQVEADKVVLGLGSYGYDWLRGKTKGEAVDYEDVMLDGRDSQDDIHMDPASLNPTVSYDDENGAFHDVWLLDATTLYNELLSQRPAQPLGAALWVLGSEDPSLWSFFHRNHLAQQPEPRSLERVAFSEEVSQQGRGELLDVISLPQSGQRTLQTNAQGVITGQTYDQYPTPFSVRNYGDQPRSIVLSFDDGPDPMWTPQILDILHRYGVPATFFVTGANSERYPDLVRREYAEGHEIGNHSYYHPDLSEVGSLREQLELSATQRAIETITGHSTHLFRPPFSVDTTPRTAEQIEPLYLAKQLGYITVGSNVDPNDWATPGVEQILYGGRPGPTLSDNAQDVTSIDGVFPTLFKLAKEPGADAFHIILLHDSGGDRSQTVAALPRIIEILLRRGYRFTTVSGLMGNKTRDALMPPLSPKEAVLIGADRAWFDLIYKTQAALQTLFLVALGLGVGRVLFVMLLAFLQRQQARKQRFTPGYQPSVSVVIAAYNEGKVIARTLQALLASPYPDLQVIVVDDGSRDDTSEVVEREFAQEPRVTLLRKANGGKASALNLGLTSATGEIIVSLDADTLFAPDTIPLLARHFEDPQVAAVAGNVKVGNRINLWTLWQSLEYIISQNFDRRAYSALNCVTVVPGAVGAWRRRAMEEAGGYLPDTLAEDTDLTLRVRRLGYRIEAENDALAWTEAPDTLVTLSRQRFRWAFGTLQCLWKHRDALFRPRYGALGMVALPTMWLFQIAFQALSPIVDLTILWAALKGNLATVFYYYALFLFVETLGAWVALRMDRENPRLLLWIFWQRFAYRQLMYYVLARSLFTAIRGNRVGWGKLERKGTAEQPATG